LRPLSQNIKTGRKKKGWSQEQASRKTGIKRCTIAAHEEGRAEPGYDTVKIYMDHFGIEEKDMWPFISNENFWK
jgi:transcriptional regulator with XRE-family HTH domain